MKITQVTIYHVHKRPTTGQRPILVRVDTDEGIYGVGEVGLAYGVGGAAGAAMVKELAARIIGKDPFRTEAIWEDFFKHTFWGQGGGTVVFCSPASAPSTLRCGISRPRHWACRCTSCWVARPAKRCVPTPARPSLAGTTRDVWC